MRGNCIGGGGGGTSTISVKLNNISSQPDADSVIGFTLEQIRDSHNHDNLYIRRDGGTTMNIARAIQWDPVGTSVVPMNNHKSFIEMAYGTDAVGFGYVYPASDNLRLVIYTKDNGDESIICRQYINSSSYYDIYLMDGSHNSSFYFVTCTGVNVTSGNRYAQQGIHGYIVALQGGGPNGNMAWAW